MTDFGDVRVILGTGDQCPVVLRDKDVSRHIHIIGVSGKGKSKHQVSQFLQLMHQGMGCSLTDPHGDQCNDILASLHDSEFFKDERAYRRLLYVKYGDPNRFIPFNVLTNPQFEPHAVARMVLEAVKRTWSGLASGNAPALENILLAGCYVLVENHRPLTALERLIDDKPFRDQLLANVTDPQVVDFFRNRFDAAGKRANLLSESTLRRLFLITFSQALRFSLGQAGNRLNFRQIMDQRVSVLHDLSELDEDSQRLLGCLITLGYETAALSRADTPEAERVPHFLTIDEFPTFSATSGVALERVLAQSRKFKLYTVLAHQTWSQLDKSIAGALQNAILIAFGLGHDDAAWAAARLVDVDLTRTKYNAVGHLVSMSGGEQEAEMARILASLPPRQAYVRIGETTEHITTIGIPEPRCTQQELAQIKERYAQLLLTPKSKILELAASSNSDRHSQRTDHDRPMPGARMTKRKVNLYPEDSGASS